MVLLVAIRQAIARIGVLELLDESRIGGVLGMSRINAPRKSVRLQATISGGFSES